MQRRVFSPECWWVQDDNYFFFSVWRGLFVREGLIREVGTNKTVREIIVPEILWQKWKILKNTKQNSEKSKKKNIEKTVQEIIDNSDPLTNMKNIEKYWKILKQIIKIKAEQLLFKQLSKIALLSTFSIFHAYQTKEWVSPPLLKPWISLELACSWKWFTM